MSENAIVFKDVLKSFEKEDGSRQVILDRVNFAIPAGKTTVVAGGSGQGKSVTLKLILALMQTDGGNITVAGEDITGMRGRRLKRLRTRFR